MTTLYRFSSEWINNLEDMKQWEYYWCQQKLLFGNLDMSEKILEVGIGTKFACNYLKSKGFNVTTIDIDHKKNPDLVMNIVDFGKHQGSFDAVLAFDIFEHIPYGEFLSVTEKMFSRGVKKLFIGMPFNQRILLEADVKVPFLKRVNLFIAVPWFKIVDEYHCWALGYNGCTPEKIKSDLQKIGYRCRNYFRHKSETYFYFTS